MPWNNERGDDPEFDCKKIEGSDVSSSPETTVQIIQKVIKKLSSLFCVNSKLPSSYIKEN